VYPEIMMDWNMVFCNFFLLLSLGRLLSMRTIRNIKHKIFDASFFIGLASLFVDWALLYLVLVFLVINLYDQRNFKNWLIPFIAIIVLGILAFTVLQFYDGLPFLKNHYQFQINYVNRDFTSFEMIKSIFYVFVIISMTILVFLKLRQKGGGKLLILRILFFAFILSVTIMSFSSKDTNFALLGFFPASAFLTNYLETIKQKRYKEIAIFLFIFIPFLILGIQLSCK